MLDKFRGTAAVIGAAATLGWAASQGKCNDHEPVSSEPTEVVSGAPTTETPADPVSEAERLNERLDEILIEIKRIDANNAAIEALAKDLDEYFTANGCEVTLNNPIPSAVDIEKDGKVARLTLSPPKGNIIRIAVETGDFKGEMSGPKDDVFRTILGNL